TAFFTQKELEAHLKQLEEAKKRDHRLLGKQLKLFTISPDMVGSGLILWMPKGATVRGILESFIKEELLKRAYQPVYTPHIGRLGLYKPSGTYPYYRASQFAPMWANPHAPDAKGHWEFLRKCIEANVPNDQILERDREFSEKVTPEIAEFPSEKYQQARDPRQ